MDVTFRVFELAGTTEEAAEGHKFGMEASLCVWESAIVIVSGINLYATEPGMSEARTLLLSCPWFGLSFTPGGANAPTEFGGKRPREGRE